MTLIRYCGAKRELHRPCEVDCLRFAAVPDKVFGAHHVHLIQGRSFVRNDRPTGSFCVGVSTMIDHFQARTKAYFTPSSLLFIHNRLMSFHILCLSFSDTNAESSPRSSGGSEYVPRDYVTVCITFNFLSCSADRLHYAVCEHRFDVHSQILGSSEAPSG